MYPKPYNIDGFITIDIILAFCLATIFIIAISNTHIMAEELFYRYSDTWQAIKLFESNTDASEIMKTIFPYGRERIETGYKIASSSLTFSSVKAKNDSEATPFMNKPICSVDLSRDKVVGAYDYANNSIDPNVLLNPIIKAITLPINPLLPLTHLEIRDGIAYVSDDSNVYSDPDLFIFDISNIDNVRLLSSINTGPGISDFVLIGNRIFAAITSSAYQLHNIKINSLNSLTLESRYALPPPYATATRPFASAIDHDDGKLYLGTEKWDGEEFIILDISNPISPKPISSLETNSKVNDIFVHEGIVYVGASDIHQFRVLDTSNPNNISVLQDFGPAGYARQEGKAIDLFEEDLSLGRTSGGFNISHEHELFFGSSTANLSDYPSLDISGGVYGIVADRRNIYLATRQIDREFQILDHDLATNSTLSFPLPVAPQGITCNDNKLYILAHTAPVIYEISFQQ